MPSRVRLPALSPAPHPAPTCSVWLISRIASGPHRAWGSLLNGFTVGMNSARESSTPESMRGPAMSS